VNEIESHLEYESEVMIHLKITKVVHTISIYMYGSILD